MECEADTKTDRDREKERQTKIDRDAHYSTKRDHSRSYRCGARSRQSCRQRLRRKETEGETYRDALFNKTIIHGLTVGLGAKSR